MHSACLRNVRVSSSRFGASGWAARATACQSMNAEIEKDPACCALRADHALDAKRAARLHVGGADRDGLLVAALELHGARCGLDLERKLGDEAFESGHHDLEERRLSGLERGARRTFTWRSRSAGGCSAPGAPTPASVNARLSANHAGDSRGGMVLAGRF
jgi:hypothetical protein